MSTKIVLTNAEAIRIAIQYAHDNNVNDARAEAFAESWFDAGKDSEKSTQSALLSYLGKRFMQEQR